MTHKYDVIYMYVNEGIQKTQNKDHSKQVVSKSKLMKFFIITNEKAFNGVFDFSTKLPEGQEIDRRSKMQYKDHFRSFDPNY